MRWFSEKFILSGELPSGTREYIHEYYDIGYRICTSFEIVSRYINKLCKLRVIGWGKHGEVQDQGVDQPSNGLPHNAARVMVEYGTLNHHINQLDHIRPGDANVDMLNQLKFDVVNGFITNE